MIQCNAELSRDKETVRSEGEGVTFRYAFSFRWRARNSMGALPHPVECCLLFSRMVTSEWTLLFYEMEEKFGNDGSII